MRIQRLLTAALTLACIMAAGAAAQASGIQFGHRIFLNTQFEDPVHPYEGLYRWMSKDNVFEVVYDREEDNRYLYFDKTLSEDPFCDVMIPGAKKLVAQMDVKVTKPGAENCIVMVRDTATASGNLDEYPVKITPALTLTCNGEFVAQLEQDEWYNVAAAFDLEANSIDLYVDRQYVMTCRGFTSQNMQVLNLFRITQLQGNAMGDLCVDNLMVYEGTRLSDCSHYVPVFTDGAYERTLLEGRTALHAQSGTAYKNGEKISLQYRPLTNRAEEVFVAAEDMNTLFDRRLSAQLSGVYEDGEPVPVDILHQKEVTYLNAVQYIRTVLGQDCVQDQTGLVLAGPELLAYSEQELDDMGGFLFFERPSAQQIGALFNAKTDNGQAHPRLFAGAEEFARIREQVKTDSVMKDWYDFFIRNANRILTYDPVTYHLPDGIRLLDTSRTVLERMEHLGMAYQMTGNQAYADRAWRELEAVFAFPDWNPPHILDTGEMITAAAIGYDWMYEGLTPDQRDMAAEKIKTMGLSYLRDAYYGRLFTAGSVGRSDTFVNWASNFNTVVNGGAVVGALAIADTDPEFCFDVVEKALRSLECMMPLLAPDGGWEEGVNYWGYNADYFMRLVGALDSCLGTDFGIMNYKGLDKTAQFAISQESPLGMNNFHDATFCNIEITPVAWFGKKFQDPDAMRYRKFTAQQVNTYRKVYDLIYYDPVLAEGELNDPLDWYTRGIEAISAKQSLTDRNGLFFASHGGETSCYHSHPDTGAFVLDLLGERWSEDLGMDTYTPTASGEYYYRKRTEGHSTIVINPDETAGQLNDTYSPVILFDSTPEGLTAVLDMTAPYSNHATRAWRGFQTGDGRTSLTIRDEIDLKADNSRVYWFMQTKAEVSCTENGAVLTRNGKQLRLEFETNGENPVIQATKAVALPTSPSLPEDIEKNAAYNRIAISYTGGGSTYLTVKLSAYDALDTGISLGSLEALVSPPEPGTQCVADYDFDRDIPRENGWFVPSQPGFSFHDGARLVTGANIDPENPAFYGYETMKYRLHLEEDGIGKKASIGYNPAYNREENPERGGTDTPYIVYEPAPSIRWPKGRQIIFQTRVQCGAPGGRISFRLVDSTGKSDHFVNLVQLRKGGGMYTATEATGWQAKYLCGWEKGKTCTVTVVFKNGSNACDIYVDGAIAAKQLPLFEDDRTVTGIGKVYLYGDYTEESGESAGKISFDGVKLYTGTGFLGELYGGLEQDAHSGAVCARIGMERVDLHQGPGPSLLLAEYDQKGAMVGISLADTVSQPCETLSCGLELRDANNRLKVFVFDSVKGLVPLREAVTIESGKIIKEEKRE